MKRTSIIAPHRRSISRFTQLLLLSILLLFLPTYLYLRSTQHRHTTTTIAAAADDHGGSDQKIAAAAAAAPKMGSQGWGPIAKDDDDRAPDWGKPKWLDSSAGAAIDPVKMKSSDFWKAAWKAPWIQPPQQQQQQQQQPQQQNGVGSPPVLHGGKEAGTGQGSTGSGILPTGRIDKVVLPTSNVQAAGPKILTPPSIPAAKGGEAFAEKMGNETAKAELGRHTWHFLHLLTLRFPDKPTPSQRETLSTFFHTFSLLYPCGECANHFQLLLKELPPQTSSRINAALWLCEVHNRVNARLGKAEFPCDKLDESYDCGCGPTPSPSKALLGPTIATSSPTSPSMRLLPRGLIPRELSEHLQGQEWMIAPRSSNSNSVGVEGEICGACEGKGSFA